MTKTSAASNGSTASEPDKTRARADGPAREGSPRADQPGLRRPCRRPALSSMTCTRPSTALGEPAEGDSPDRLKVLNEALGCLRTTEHYLLMLSSVFEEQDHGAPDRWSPDPAF